MDVVTVVRRCKLSSCAREFSQPKLGRSEGHYRHYCSDEHAFLSRAARRKSRALTLGQYGLTEVDYDRMLASQGGCCAICGANVPGKNRGSTRPDSFCVDHDHRTGKVRALLCRGCNSGLGHLKDDPALLRRAADYLVAHR